jgi:branched-chain amino acid transport system permease protein
VFKFKELRTSFFIALWIMLITFPIMIIRVNTITETIDWRWSNLIGIGVGSFIVSHLWRFLLERVPQERKRPEKTVTHETSRLRTIVSRVLDRSFWRQRKVSRTSMIILAGVAVFYPMFTSLYQTNIMISALIYVILALGLNVVIGLGGLLHLGFAAFFAFGAYTYGLLNYYFGIGFWLALPLGALVAALVGILLGFAVLRLSGDYLAIVTLGFGEIVRIVLQNWIGLTNGPKGLPGIDRPQFFGLKMNLFQVTDYIYYIALAVTIITIFVVRRLEYSRLGRAWEAMREDDIAAESMGVDLAKSKLTSFSLGAMWAGLAGVLFAAKTTFVGPASFSLLASITMLLAIVLGGIGSIPGVIVGALVVSLLPEILREFAEYRMIIFGALLVIMMVFRPGGIIQKRRQVHTLDLEDGVPTGVLADVATASAESVQPDTSGVES